MFKCYIYYKKLKTCINLSASFVFTVGDGCTKAPVAAAEEPVERFPEESHLRKDRIKWFVFHCTIFDSSLILSFIMITCSVSLCNA